MNQLILVKIIGFEGFNKLFEETRVGAGFDFDRLLLALKGEMGFHRLLQKRLWQPNNEAAVLFFVFQLPQNVALLSKFFGPPVSINLGFKIFTVYPRQSPIAIVIVQKRSNKITMRIVTRKDYVIAQDLKVVAML